MQATIEGNDVAAHEGSLEHPTFKNLLDVKITNTIARGNRVGGGSGGGGGVYLRNVDAFINKLVLACGGIIFTAFRFQCREAMTCLVLFVTQDDNAAEEAGGGVLLDTGTATLQMANSKVSPVNGLMCGGGCLIFFFLNFISLHVSKMRQCFGFRYWTCMCHSPHARSAATAPTTLAAS